MKNKIGLLAVLVFTILPVSFANSAGNFVKGLTEKDMKEMKEDVLKKDYLSSQARINANCGLEEYEKKSNSLTIDQRNIEIGRIVNCLREGQATMTTFADDLNTKSVVTAFSAPMIEKAEAKQKEAKSEADFMGLSWGIGFGFSYSLDEAIDDAEIVNGIVRVKSNKKEQPRLVFEFHKYFWCNNGRVDGTRGCGPFVAVSATQDEVLSGVGMGFMYGFKSKATDPDGFSIGFGGILDANVTDLADGFEANKPPPAGETTIRYETKSRWSYLLFATRTF